jgi:hypothetical protein
MIYGSDQIWNQTITGDDWTYFGFRFNGKKIAYAASDGGRLQINEKVVGFLDQFYALSCREQSLANRLNGSLPNKQLVTACDPVFLLSQAEWSELTEPVKDKDYILVYQIGENENLEDEVLALGKRLGKKIVQVNNRRSIRTWFSGKVAYRTAVTPQQFVSYFKYASIVVTTSFHGTAFSVLFNKPFAVMKFQHGSDRVKDLLATLGLSDRWVSKLDEVSVAPNLFTNDIMARIESYKTMSESFLVESLR